MTASVSWNLREFRRKQARAERAYAIWRRVMITAPGQRVPPEWRNAHTITQDRWITAVEEQEKQEKGEK